MTNVDSVQDSVSIEQLVESDITTMLEINEQGLPELVKSITKKWKIAELSELSLGFSMIRNYSDLLLFTTKNRYGSLNYAWFNERYDEFIYVDGIAVATDARNQGIGSMPYEKVFEYAKTNNIPVTAEVSLRPPNQGSDRFHLRHGYQVVGELDHGEKAVTMYIKPLHPQMIEAVKSSSISDSTYILVMSRTTLGHSLGECKNK